MAYSNRVEYMINKRNSYFSMAYHLLLLLLLHRHKELKFSRKLILGIQSIREVYSSNSAVSMNLNSECFDIVSAICSSCEIREVELNLVPSLV